MLLIIAAAITVYKERDFTIFKKSYTKFFLLMILAETLSTIFGYDPAKSLHSWSSFWVVGHLFCIYIIFDGKNRERYFVLMFIGMIISVFYSLPQMAVLVDHRVKGFYSHPLTYGNVTAMMFTAAVGLLMFTMPKDKKLKYFMFIACVFCLAGLLLSGGRGPMLSSFVSILAMIIYRYKTKGVAIAMAILVTVTVVAVSTPFIKDRFTKIETDMETGSNTSVGTRMVLWEATSKAIMEKPLFGYGKGNFKPVVSKYIDVPVASMAHAHNSYLQYTFVNGFFGLIALLLFLSALFRHVVRSAKTNPYAKTAIFVLVVYMLEGLTENNFNDSEVVMAAYIIIALLITPVREKTYHLFSRS